MSDLYPSPSSQISVEMKLLLKFECLISSVGLTSSLWSLTSICTEENDRQGNKMSENVLKETFSLQEILQS
jgi:hypothetical protein